MLSHHGHHDNIPRISPQHPQIYVHSTPRLQPGSIHNFYSAHMGFPSMPMYIMFADTGFQKSSHWVSQQHCFDSMATEFHAFNITLSHFISHHLTLVATHSQSFNTLVLIQRQSVFSFWQHTFDSMTQLLIWLSVILPSASSGSTQPYLSGLPSLYTGVGLLQSI